MSIFSSILFTRFLKTVGLNKDARRVSEKMVAELVRRVMKRISEEDLNKMPENMFKAMKRIMTFWTPFCTFWTAFYTFWTSFCTFWTPFCIFWTSFCTFFLTSFFTEFAFFLGFF